MLRRLTRFVAFPSYLSRTIQYTRGDRFLKLLGGIGLGTLIAAALVGGATVGSLTAQSSPPQIIQLTNTAVGGPGVRLLGPSRDGSRVVFWTEGRLMSVSNDGSGLTQVTPSSLNVILASHFGTTVSHFGGSSGSKAVFVACQAPCGWSNLGQPGNLFVVNADGTGLTQLTADGDGVGIAYQRAWISADGGKIVFVRSQHLIFSLFVMNSDGTNLQQLSVPSADLLSHRISLSSDGSKLALVYAPQGTVRIALLNTDGTGFQDVVEGYIPALSGDGSTIAYAALQGVAVIKSDGTGQRILDTIPYADPSITYDGTQVCYTGLVAFQKTDVVCINTDGTNRRNLTNTPAGVGASGFPLSSNLPAISENGAVVAFSSDADLDVGKNTDFNFELFVALLVPTVPAPTVTSITPGSGPIGGGTAVSITGTGFLTGASVTIGGASATNVNVAPTTITAVTPPHAAGPVDVVVTNPSGQIARLAGAFRYLAPPVAGFVMTFESNSAFDGDALALRIRPRGTALVLFSAVERTSDPDGSLVSWQWSLNDVSTSSLDAFSSNLSSGVYVISLTVTDNDGLQDSATGLVLINRSTMEVVAIEVVDGDTLRLASPTFCGTDQLRVIGVDTPELRDLALPRSYTKDREKLCVDDADVHPLATRASAAVNEWLGKPSRDNRITLTVALPDRQRCERLDSKVPSRLLAHVFLTNSSTRRLNLLSSRLISEGLGLSFVEEWYKNISFINIEPQLARFFMGQQREAQAAVAGFWGPVGSEPAWPARCAISLRSPSDSQFGLGTTVELRWTAMSGAAQYRIQVARQVTASDKTAGDKEIGPVEFTELAVPEQTAVAPRVRVSVSLPSNGRYWWRVTALDANNQIVEKSAVWSFTVGPRP